MPGRRKGTGWGNWSIGLSKLGTKVGRSGVKDLPPSAWIELYLLPTDTTPTKESLYIGSEVVGWPKKKKKSHRNFLVSQWLGLVISLLWAWVQSLVEELRSCKLRGTAKKKQQISPQSTVLNAWHPCISLLEYLLLKILHILFYITCIYHLWYNRSIPVKNTFTRDFFGGPVTKTPCFQCKGLGFDPWWGIGSHVPQLGVCMLQLKIPHAVTKTWDSQIKTNSLIIIITILKMHSLISQRETTQNLVKDHIHFRVQDVEMMPITPAVLYQLISIVCKL